MSTNTPVPESGDEDARAREAARLMALKIVVIVLGVILVAMALVVFSTLIVRAVKGRGAEPAAAPPASPVSAGPQAVAGVMAPGSPVTIPPGARVVSSALGEGRLALTLEREGRLTVIVLDSVTLREIARTELAPPR